MTKPTIVCVDDDPAILTLVARVLNEYDVRTTELATQALRWITQGEVAVVVSDYDMPDMTGAQLLGQVKRACPETVRVLLTGRRELEAAVDGINQGEIFRFLSKPFNHLELRATVAEAVERYNVMVELSGERARQVRRRALHEALENEFPAISRVERAGDGHYEVRDPVILATELGLSSFVEALGRKR